MTKNVITLYNYREKQSLSDCEDRMNAIGDTIDELTIAGKHIPFLLILEARMIARQVANIRAYAHARTLRDLGFDYQAKEYEELAVAKEAARKELSQIIEFLSNPMTKVTLPPIVTDEDESFFV